MTIRNLTCAELEARLGDYLEGTLADAAVADVELHLSGCAACAALVRAFEGVVREAAALPALTPSRDLWPAIEARLATRVDAPTPERNARHGVIDLAAHLASQDAAAREGSAREASRHVRTWRRLRTGALAAGLVGITAVATWFASSQVPVQSAETVPGRLSPSPADAAGPAAAPGADVPVGRDVGSASTQVAATGRPAGDAGLTAASHASRPAVTAALDREITALREVLTERSEQLDPRTVAVLETSLSTIDSAITEARRALQADPASRFLSSQLDKALEKKLGLLRTAALLPART
jgi:hypothetical protein